MDDADGISITSASNDVGEIVEGRNGSQGAIPLLKWKWTQGKQLTKKSFI